jgi:hypothetical protein
MVFVLAWPIGDAHTLACQSLHQVHFVYSSISSGLLTCSKFNSILRYGTSEKVPWSGSFGFVALPFVALKVWCLFVIYVWSYFEIEC